MKGSSTNLEFASLTMTAASKSTNAAKNTNGFDIGASTYVTITDFNVSNDDDYVAFKSGCNYVTVFWHNMHWLPWPLRFPSRLGRLHGHCEERLCHGRATMINSSKAVGIKLHPGGSAHGTATVSNVTYDGVTVTNCDYAAQIQSCYNEDASYYASYPSTASVTGVYFKNFIGTTSTKYEPDVANRLSRGRNL